MDKTNLLKYFTVSKKATGLEYKTHHVFDNFAKRDKKLTIISPDNYNEFSMNHFASLFNIFSSEDSHFLEYLLEWGILEDQSLYILRDARDISMIPDELFLVRQIPLIILDILIGLYAVHRNNFYYGGVKKEDLLYKYSRRHNIDGFSYYLSGAKILKAEINSDILNLQREDIKSLVFSIISFVKNKERAKHASVNSLNMNQLVEYFIKDKIIRDIILEIFRAEESITYYIRLLVKNLFFNNEPQREFYNSIIQRLPCPDIPLERHRISPEEIKKHKAVVISGVTGIGKSFYIKDILNIYRKMKYAPFVINAAQHSTSNYDFIRNITDLINVMLRKNDSMTLEKPASSSEEMSFEERMYLLYRFDQAVRPVFVLENADHADENTLLLFRTIIESGISVIITNNNDISSDGYIRLVKGLKKESIYPVVLDEWNANEICSFLERVFFNENKKKIRIMSEMLFKKGLKTPKKVRDMVNYLHSREKGLFNYDINDFKNSIEINIDLFRDFKEKLFISLNPDESRLLRTLYLFPCDVEGLCMLHSMEEKRVKDVLNSLLLKKMIFLDKNKYMVKDRDISSELSAKLSRHELHDEYRRIGAFLLKGTSVSRAIHALNTADYLIRGGYCLEAAKLILDYSGESDRVLEKGRHIWYYNKALDIFRQNRMKKEQVIILERLFEIHYRRSDYSKAETILHFLSRAGYDSFKLHKKYALLLESTGDYKRAIDYYNRAFSSIKKSTDSNLKIDIYIDIARLLLKTYREDSARDILQKAIITEKESNNMDRHNIILSLLGELYLLEGDIDSSLKAFIESAELSEKITDYYTLSHTLSGIGLLYFRKRSFDKAYVYYKKSLDLAIRNDNIQGISLGYSNLGKINMVSGNFSGAYEQYTNAMILHQKTGDRKQYVNDSYRISYLLTEKGELSRAYYSVKEGLDIAEKVKDQELKAMMLSSFGRIYHCLGSYGESVNYHYYSRVIAKKQGFKEFLARINNSLSSLMFDLGDYVKSGQFAQKSIILEEELRTNEFIPLNNALITASRIFLGDADDPLAMIRELKNEENLPDDFYRFRYYKTVYDAGRYLGVRDLMIYCLQMIKDLNLGAYSVWYDLVQALCHQWLFNDMPEEAILKHLETANQMDFSELQWVWEYVLANHLYSAGKQQESYNHYLGAYEKIKDRLYSISEIYRNAYISSPFRRFAYEKGEKVFQKFSSLYY